MSSSKSVSLNVTCSRPQEHRPPSKDTCLSESEHHRSCSCSASSKSRFLDSIILSRIPWPAEAFDCPSTGNQAVSPLRQLTFSASDSSSNPAALAASSIAPHDPGRGLVVVPARRSVVERQDRVAREVGRNGLGCRRMDLHHLVVMVEDRFEDRIDEVVRQIGARDGEIVDADGLVVAPKRRIGAGRDHRRRDFRHRQPQRDHRLARRQRSDCEYCPFFSRSVTSGNRHAGNHRPARRACAPRAARPVRSSSRC